MHGAYLYAIVVTRFLLKKVARHDTAGINGINWLSGSQSEASHKLRQAEEKPQKNKIMKKLMIAAAAAAMIGGAQAEIVEKYAWYTEKDALFDGVVMNTTTSTNELGVTNIVYDNKIALDQLQVITFKSKAYSNKQFCLNDEKNDVDNTFKPSATRTVKTAAVDGAIYYNGSVWVALAWNKNYQNICFMHTKEEGEVCCWRDADDEEFGSKDGKTFDYEKLGQYNAENGNPAPVDFDCYYDKGGKKVWGAVNAFTPFDINWGANWRMTTTYVTTRKGKDVEWAKNLVATAYAEIDVKNEIAKNIKTTGSDYTITLKTYNDVKSFDKAIEAIEKKFEKAGGYIPTQK